MTLTKMLVKRSYAIWKDALQLSQDRKYKICFESQNKENAQHVCNFYDFSAWVN